MTPESALGLDVAGQTIKNHFDKIARLYEQGAGIERIGRYVKGWWQWVNTGVDVIVQKAEDLWKLKWDGLHGGIKRYIKRSYSDVHSDAESVKNIITSTKNRLDPKTQRHGCRWRVILRNFFNKHKVNMHGENLAAFYIF